MTERFIYFAQQHVSMTFRVFTQGKYNIRVFFYNIAQNTLRYTFKIHVDTGPLGWLLFKITGPARKLLASGQRVSVSFARWQGGWGRNPLPTYLFLPHTWIRYL